MKNPFTYITERGVPRTIHSHRMMPLLGLKPGGHLPADGMAPQMVNDIAVYVLSKAEAERTKRFHRVIAICPCGKHVPFGRMGQHVKVHP